MQPEEYYSIQELLPGKKAPAYDVVARYLQRAVSESEKAHLNQGLDQYTDTEVNQAIVHTRQDMVLVISYLRWITGLMRRIEIAIWIVAALLAIFVSKYIFKG